MKVLFVNPSTSFEQIYGDWDLSALDTYTPPLGIMHIASYIREHGHEPHILDLQVGEWGIDGVVESICALQPDVLGLSSMTINCLNAKRISEELRNQGFQSPIVMGGAHITAVPEITLREFTAVDYAVLGEGEETFLELLETLGSNGPIQNVKGIAWRRAPGEIVINDRRPFIQDLDKLPFPAWDLLDDFPRSYPSSLLESKRVPAAGIMTSRGCPFHCTFCDNTVFGTRVRNFSADYSLKMIRHLIDNYQIKDLMFFDDNFLLSKEKLSKICNGIIDESLDLTWFCIAHAKSMKKERLELARRAGCWFVEMGIESGNDDILKEIRKTTDTAEIARAAENAHQSGLMTKGNFIFGFPGDTAKTLEESVQFALDIDIDFFQQSFLTIWPGCEISSQIETNSPTDKHSINDWKMLAHQRVTFVPSALTEAELISISKTAFRKFYLRPKIVFRLFPLFMTRRGLKLGIVAFRVFLQTILRRK